MSKLFEDMIVTDEDAEIVQNVTGKTVSITISIGNAIVLSDVLRQAAVSIARDAVQCVINGETEDAEMLALVGLEVTSFIDKTDEAIKTVDKADVLLEIAKRSSASAREVNKLKGETLQ